MAGIFKAGLREVFFSAAGLDLVMVFGLVAARVLFAGFDSMTVLTLILGVADLPAVTRRAREIFTTVFFSTAAFNFIATLP
jgi:hypothetical protein